MKSVYAIHLLLSLSKLFTSYCAICNSLIVLPMSSDSPANQTSPSQNQDQTISHEFNQDVAQTEPPQQLEGSDRPLLSNDALLVDSNFDPQQLESIQQKLALDQQRLQIRQQLVAQQVYEQDAAWLRKSRMIQQLAQGIVGLAILGTGISFTAFEHGVGPYLMGFGTAATTISVTGAIATKRPSSIDPQDEPA